VRRCGRGSQSSVDVCWVHTRLGMGTMKMDPHHVHHFWGLSAPLDLKYVSSAARTLATALGEVQLDRLPAAPLKCLQVRPSWAILEAAVTFHPPRSAMEAQHDGTGGVKPKPIVVRSADG
jgi:hypothetical protein